VHTLRFAPTPTGDLHIGSAWIVWQNYSQAASSGGRFVLRVDDMSYWIQQMQRDPSTVPPAVRKAHPVSDPCWLDPHSEPFQATMEMWAKRYTEDLEWLGCPPDVVVLESAHYEAHKAVASRLGIPWEQPRWAGAGAQHLNINPPGNTAAWTNYHPCDTLRHVVSDYEEGVTGYYRGEDLIQQALLYDYLWRVAYGGNPPQQYYLPLVTFGVGAPKCSKSAPCEGTSLRELRAAGYDPGFIRRALFEAYLDSDAKRLRDTVIPAGTFDRTGNDRGKWRGRMRLSGAEGSGQKSIEAKPKPSGGSKPKGQKA
jgi:hypothetical protein